MTRRVLSAMASVVFVSATVYVAGRNQAPVLGQGGDAAAGAPGVAGRGAAPGQGRGGRGGPAPVPPRSLLKLQRRMISPGIGCGSRQKTGAGLWLSRQKGNADSIPISPAGRAILDAWDPAKDEAEGNQCKGYGAGAISRIPTRTHVTWQDREYVEVGNRSGNADAFVQVWRCRSAG